MGNRRRAIWMFVLGEGYQRGERVPVRDAPAASDSDSRGLSPALIEDVLEFDAVQSAHARQLTDPYRFRRQT